MNVAFMVKTFHLVKRLLTVSLHVNALNERIKRARERAGLTVNRAAELLGVKRTQVWRMENQDFSLSAERLFELSDHYGVDPRTLFLGQNIDAADDTRFDRVGDIVAFVEDAIQSQKARPSAERVREAVIEVLKQDAAQPSIVRQEPFDPEPYRGLVMLIFKKDN